MTDGECTVVAALALARSRGVERLDAQLLLAHCLGRNRAWLLAHGEFRLPHDQAAAYAGAIERRAHGVPLAYLTGAREFYRLMLQVTPDVLVPRPETELLVDWALELLAGPLSAHTEPLVVDLGTGSGAIALAIKLACPRATVLAVDSSEPALRVACSNATRLDLKIDLVRSDWWQAVPPSPADLVISNPPYVAEGDPHLPALQHEPQEALVSGRDGLDAVRRIVGGAPSACGQARGCCLSMVATKAERYANA